MKKPLTKTIKYFYGIADLGYAVANNVELYFFIFFCTNIAKFSLGTVAFIGSLSAIANMILTPIYGVIIAKTKPMRWGRFRSWMLITPPICAVFFSMEFSKIGSSQLIAATIVIIGTIMFDQMYSFANVAHASLVNKIANNANERSIISSRRGTYQSVASILNSYLGQPLAALFALWVGQEFGYTLMAFTLTMLMAVTFWLTVAMTRGYESATDAEEQAVEQEAEKMPLGQMIGAAIRNKRVLALIVSDCLRYLGNNVLIASVTYYFVYIAQNIQLQVYYMLFGGILQIAGSFLSGYIAKKFSARTTAILAMFFVGSLEILCRFLGFYVGIAFGILMVYRFCHGCGISLYPALIADCAAYDEYKNHTSVPFTIGIIAIAPKIASLVRSWIIPAVLAIVGFSSKIDPKTASYDVKIGVLNMFMLIPGCITIFAGLILLLFYDLTKAKLGEMNKNAV